MNNIVFYFSGTGNCLKVSKTIAKELGNTEIVSMANDEKYTLSGNYNSVGFVYPVYFSGLPNIVIRFINNLNINSNNAYFYTIATFGGMAYNGLSQFNELFFKKHNIKLNNGYGLRMFSNYVNMYNMSKNVNKISIKSDKRLVPIIKSIKEKLDGKIKKSNLLLNIYYSNVMKNISSLDKYYNVNNNCNGCGICKEVCPVKNIEIENKKPLFKNNCEQCVACIQYCPQKAINYKNLTQKRRRYTNPEINYKELSEMNKRAFIANIN